MLRKTTNWQVRFVRNLSITVQRVFLISPSILRAMKTIVTSLGGRASSLSLSFIAKVSLCLYIFIIFCLLASPMLFISIIKIFFYHLVTYLLSELPFLASEISELLRLREGLLIQQDVRALTAVASEKSSPSTADLLAEFNSLESLANTTRPLEKISRHQFFENSLKCPFPLSVQNTPLSPAGICRISETPPFLSEHNRLITKLTQAIPSSSPSEVGDLVKLRDRTLCIISAHELRRDVGSYIAHLLEMKDVLFFL